MKYRIDWKQALASLLLTALCALGTTACTDENASQTPDVAPKGTFTLTVEGAGLSTETRATGTEAGKPNECNASRIELFYFDAAAADGGRCIAVQTVLPAAGLTAIALPTSIRFPDAVFTHTGDVWVRAITSVATGLSAETDPAKITRQRLDALIYDGAVSANALFYPDGTTRFIPMTCEGKITPDGLNNSLKLERVIAKIRLKVDATTLPATLGITLDAAAANVRMLNAPAEQTLLLAASEHKHTYALVASTPFAGQDADVPLRPETNEAGTVSYNHHAYMHETDGTHPSQTAPLMMEVQLPYTNAAGKRVENNYYRFELPAYIRRNTIYNVTLHVKGFGSETDAFTVTIDTEKWGVENKQAEVGKIHVESKYDLCQLYVEVGDEFTVTELTPNVDIKVAAPTNFTLVKPADGIVKAGVKTPIVLRYTTNSSASTSLILTDLGGNISINSPINISLFTTTKLTSGYHMIDFPSAATYYCNHWQDAEFTDGVGSAYTRATATTNLVTNKGTRCHINGNLTNKTKTIEIGRLQSGLKIANIYRQPARTEFLSYQSDADGVYISSVGPVNLDRYFNTAAYDMTMTSEKGLSLNGTVISQTGDYNAVNDAVIAADKQSRVTLSFKRAGSGIADVSRTFFFNRVKFYNLIYIDRNNGANSPTGSGIYKQDQYHSCPAGYRLMTNAEALAFAANVTLTNGYQAKPLTEYTPNIARWTDPVSGNIIYWSKGGSKNFGGAVTNVTPEASWINYNIVAYSLTEEGKAFTIDAREPGDQPSGSRLASEIDYRASALPGRCLRSPK